MLSDDLKTRLTGRVAVVGVGEVGRGDDGVGPLVAGLLTDAGVPGVIDSGVSPELDTWRVREIAPDSVLFVDAAEIGGVPGDAALLSPADLRKSGFDTHRAPLKLTMEYLESDLGCKCFLLAVEPEDVRHGAPMCREVRDSAANLAEILISYLSPETCPNPSFVRRGVIPAPLLTKEGLGQVSG